MLYTIHEVCAFDNKLDFAKKLYGCYISAKPCDRSRVILEPEVCIINQHLRYQIPDSDVHPYLVFVFTRFTLRDRAILRMLRGHRRHYP